MRYLEQTAWRVIVQGDTSTFYTGTNPLTTFAPLAAAARGLGFLSITADRDGAFRRVPLLVRYGAGFYPSFAFRVACEYLGVSPDKILVRPGKHIVLRDVQHPGGATPHDVVIPIDRSGNMVINYLGTWERLEHYNLADILLASEDRDELDKWGDGLAGKIVVVADVSTGSSDVGAMPLDVTFPLSGLHTNIIHTILTETFLRELSIWEMALIEASLLLIIFAFSYCRIPLWPFELGILAIVCGYIGLVLACFFYGGLICNNVISPLLMVFLANTGILLKNNFGCCPSKP